MASRNITGKSNYIYVIQNGKWILGDLRREMNDVAKLVTSFIKLYSQFSGADTTSAEVVTGPNRKYNITDFYITSMYRPKDANGSPHRADKAVDFVVKPLSLMPRIYNDLAALGSGSGRNIYIAAPLNGGDVPLHIHYDSDTSRHGNYKAIEYEATPGTGTLAQLTPDTARKILNAYGLSQDDQSSINALLDKRSGGVVTIPGYTPGASQIVDTIDAAKNITNALGDGGTWQTVLTIAAIGLVAFGGWKAYQFYKAANPKKKPAEG